MTGDERLAKVAEVLRKHGIYGFNGSQVACRCSQREWRYLLDWHDHVAQTLAPLLTEFRAEDEARIQRALLAARVVCPVHGIPDCAPLLNGCQIPRYIAEWRGEFLADLRAALAAEPDAGER